MYIYIYIYTHTYIPKTLKPIYIYIYTLIYGHAGQHRGDQELQGDVHAETCGPYIILE